MNFGVFQTWYRGGGTRERPLACRSSGIALRWRFV